MSKLTREYVRGIKQFEAMIIQMRGNLKRTINLKVQVVKTYKNAVRISTKATVIIGRMRSFLNHLRKSWDEVDEETKKALLSAVKKYTDPNVKDADEAIKVLADRIEMMHNQAKWIKIQAEQIFPVASTLELLHKNKNLHN